MLPAPDCAGPQRLLALQVRWELEERALATVLDEIEHELDERLRDHAFHSIVGEPCAELTQRCHGLRYECDALNTELAEVRLALGGIRGELARADGNCRKRTPA